MEEESIRFDLLKTRFGRKTVSLSILESQIEVSPSVLPQLDALIKVSDWALIAQRMYSYNSILGSVINFFLDSNQFDFPVDKVANESDADYTTRRGE